MSMGAQSLEMKGVILAGGRGTRLYPLTLTTSKQLLPAGSKTLVEHVLGQLVAADVKDIILLIDERHASEYMSIIRDGRHLGARSLSYVWQSPDGKGLPSAIERVQYLVGDSKFIAVCGDVLVEDGIAKAVANFATQGEGSRMALMPVNDTAGYSPVEIEDDTVITIHPKRKSIHSKGLIDLGVYMYGPDVFDKIKGLTPSSRGETEIWELNDIYVQARLMNATVLSGWWSDVGTSLETYYKAAERYRES